MKILRRNAIIIAVILFVCAAVYLNWAYNRQEAQLEAGEAGREGAAAVLADAGDGLWYEAPAAPAAAAPAPAASSLGTEVADYFTSARLNRQKARAEASGKPDLNILFIINMPFRAMAKMAGGLVSRKMVEDILFLVNGHFWRGLGRLIRDYFRNRKKERDFVKLLEGKPNPVGQSSETEGFG